MVKKIARRSITTWNIVSRERDVKTRERLIYNVTVKKFKRGKENTWIKKKETLAKKLFQTRKKLQS